MSAAPPLFAALDSADPSVLLAIEALLATPDGAVDRATLRRAIEGALAGHGETAYIDPDEAERYLDDHVLPRLLDLGLLERTEDGHLRRTDRLRAETAALRRYLAGHPRLRPRTPAAAFGARLEARGLVKIYRGRRVVNEVDLALQQGEIVGLLGPNGAGKTTTFYMIVGLIAPDRGRVLLDGEDITRVPMFRRARRGIGYLAQEPSVFRKLSVEDNLRAILEMRPLPRAERDRRLEALLDELGLRPLRHVKAYALSGGERRRLEITRALVGEPKFMLLDEPFAGVDPIAVHDIQQIVADLKRRGIGVLISDHNVEQTLDIVDRAYIMYDGRVCVAGTVSELVWSEEVADIYLGPTLTARMRQRYPRPDAAAR